jgi:mRNA-degrading endonuclease RelE of RelBE toxin-antitoxin system
MAKRPKFTLTFAAQAIEHLDRIETKYHGLLRQAIKEQLADTPADETSNRKPLESPAPFDASWDLRCGPKNRFRVFHDVDSVSRTVWILAIGIKDRSRLLIAEEEHEA